MSAWNLMEIPSMLQGLPSVIELVSGLLCLGLAIGLFRPMKRYYAAHQPAKGSDAKGGNEAVLLAWGVLVAVAFGLLFYPFF
jgi:hypothetical protein